MKRAVRILIADDHAVVRAGLRALLEKHGGYEVVAEAGSGEEAVEKALAQRPEIAVVDVRMGGMSGIDVCRQITQKLPACRVIMLTSYAEDDLLFSAIRAGAAGYLLKRVGDNDLIKAIEQVSRGESILDPAMTNLVFDEMRKIDEEHRIAAFAQLTSQELSVLSLVAHGYTNRQIAGHLYLGEGTVRNYVSSILSKINAANRAEAAAYATRNHIDQVVPPPASDTR